MRAGLFRLNDRQWAYIAPHLPTNLTGPERDDDRCIISGIVHMLQCGARWRDGPPDYGPYTIQSLQSLGQARMLAGDLRGSGPLREGQRDLVDRLHLDQGASLGERRKRGEHEQAIGHSRGGRTTKIHALSARGLLSESCAATEHLDDGDKKRLRAAALADQFTTPAPAPAP